MEQPNLKEFIQKTIEEINGALPEGYFVDDAINFEISVTTSKARNGGIELKVISGRIQKDQEIVQKIDFSVINQNQKEIKIKNTGDTVLKYINKVMRQFKKLGLESNG